MPDGIVWNTIYPTPIRGRFRTEPVPEAGVDAVREEGESGEEETEGLMEV